MKQHSQDKRTPLILAQLALLTLALFASGCATVTRGTSEDIELLSDPSGANVKLSNGIQAKTPATVSVARKKSFSATFSKEGYNSQTVHVETKISSGGAAGLAGNILVGGIIGIGVDAATGSSLSHDPNPVYVKLIPLGSAENYTPQTPTESSPGASTQTINTTTSTADYYRKELEREDLKPALREHYEKKLAEAEAQEN